MLISTMYLHLFKIFLLHDGGVGGGVSLLWPKFSPFVCARLILLTNNMNGYVVDYVLVCFSAHAVQFRSHCLLCLNGGPTGVLLANTSSESNYAYCIMMANTT
ncbi:hypothetical protein L873DRAFT_885942 [Choiromyces venosus 120613-1]|uniref:Uncharacterized protein n=1 Tax=Choiromyces venosus 120613-1 TaxID=1336337 RepID=A0A3N4JNJ0_9PEZI|nr:hypothetical protein L873DRAFT_885942 [Choiromyces venosus 120613-1]